LADVIGCREDSHSTSAFIGLKTHLTKCAPNVNIKLLQLSCKKWEGNPEKR